MMKNATCLPLALCLWSCLSLPPHVDAQAPKLSISSTNNQSFVLSWPAATTGYVLESVGELSGGSWLPISEQPTNANGEIRVVKNVSAKTQFFRLALSPVSFAAADFEIAGYQLIDRTAISP